jgi:flavin reductase (DIM6/NTAB) family NADH-FMN oxidoreductase RutF
VSKSPLTVTSGDDARADPLARERFRECMGHFTTGVTVVIAEGPGGPAGATINSFTSVSLDPLLVLASLSHTSRTLEAVRVSARFTVSVLARGQQDVARRFSRTREPFPHEDVSRSTDGQLYVREALAYLSCHMHSLITLGDHDVVVGEIDDMGIEQGHPLVFHRGDFVELGLGEGWSGGR